MLNGKTIVLGVSGGIAVFKAAALCSKLAQAGAEVRVIMTEAAAQFVAPLTFQTLSRHAVANDTFDEKDPSVVSHIDLADRADLVVIAPATANIIGKMALGLADDMLSTMLLATTAPIFVCPAMNVHMLAHPAVQANLQTLADRGVRFIEPGTGQLACGYVGKGRLAEPEDIVTAIESFFNEKKPLRGKRVLVTAGATVERIDPVRYLTNDSSGKMGYAIAEQAARMGAEVTLVTGKATAAVPAGVKLVRAESTLEMMNAVLGAMDQQDVIVKAAAVADYRPAEQAEQKIKKTESEMTLKLVKNPDILQAVGERKKASQMVIGFAAETHNVEAFAIDKLKRKRCDLIVANDVTVPGAGFGTDTNVVRVYDADGLVLTLPLMEKREVAVRLLAFVANRLTKGETTEECTPK
ncbi:MULTISPECIES: bifunctional phosphopantothenoylcysteine decarboxylase/phosphopantothenate--cysteine ligase CoaBC [unclassified Paenibacillus]|uniref:bifunctional phosphopantothenoylcysteine decarboxylase/phosphopantothenate--cysteine ligase CoaBC n=1 Tax=unclassified Paenibacillus TaxID=185978 RepID=UPI001AEACEB6|nr:MULTISPECIES: bifunctional phosphopantothenoylcysteine decarboxylase/phosphopantothenate--cysteine ligase CoaBC [unclassified Paenibacillus]MBP1156096.1 phosphopantothenoylcysteine decarboxylase/phosphopantothenate--cysteine ligase [Paenibacillus sp. PvP091]MBP1168518.1 phosphopantothenoylcysteine decarboxylase/phosphopantothenate--cysteine ligase [Paenibacillus sp. PvR098]MBP2439546.1 phosphopantothenoylcysteine decarboxylase/phosphopantothenate--cysteine ligase [Paenibacillus sp. PvP052]